MERKERTMMDSQKADSDSASVEEPGQRQSNGRLKQENLDHYSMMAVCAYLYYIKKPALSQQEIAALFKIHKSKVSRILKQAVEGNIISFRLNLPEIDALRAALISNFHLYDAWVVPTYKDIWTERVSGCGSLLKRMLGESAAKLISTERGPLKNGMHVGISCGESLLQSFLNIVPDTAQGLTIFPLTVESVPEMAYQSPSTLVGVFHAKCFRNSESYGPQLISPSTLADKKQHRLLLARLEEQIRDLSQEMDIAFVGIGNVDFNDYKSGYMRILRHADIDPRILEKHKVIGEINNRPYDAQGKDKFKEIEGLEKHLFAIDLDEIRNHAKTKPVVAVAGGKQKIEAIRVALETRIVNILVTDMLTAEALLKHTA